MGESYFFEKIKINEYLAKKSPNENVEGMNLNLILDAF